MSAPFDFSTFPVLTTPRLRLRRLLPSDAASVVALHGDERVMRFLAHPPTDTVEKALGLVEWFDQLYAEKKGLQWAMTLRQPAGSQAGTQEGDEGPMIGDCGFYAWNPEHRRVDIGYHVMPDYWGQGFATEAARAMIRWAFDQLGVHRVQADCTEGNIASESVMRKCGFHYEGLWRESCWEHGRFVNIKQFGLLRHEFKGLG